MQEFYFVKITISNISILRNVQSVFMKRWNLNLKKWGEIEIKMSNSCKDCPSSSKPIPESNDYSNLITAAAKTMTETNTGTNQVRSITSDNKQENPTLEALTLEFYTLLKHITEYIEQQANK
jgi:hypothetical protein